MKAIKITQQILDQNPNSFVSGKPIGTYQTSNLPNRFWVTKKIDCSYNFRTELHDSDGWVNFNPSPIYDISTQKVNRNVIVEVLNEQQELIETTYQVIDKTEKEIQNEIVSSATVEREVLLKEIQDKEIIDQAQTVEDTEALYNQALFPFYITNGFQYELNYKCQDFNNENELVLWKCVQPYLSIGVFRPRDIPAHFTRVAYPNQILDWKSQGGSGTSGSYNLADQVYHDNPNDGGNIWLYESKIPANTTEPGRDGTFDRWWQPIQPK